VTLRQPILYAELMWRNQRIWVLMLVAAGAVVSPALLIANGGRFDPNIGVFLLYLPLGLLYGAAMLYYRRRSAAEITEEGVRVTRLIKSALIPYDLIRQVRVQKLELHFQDDRKRLIRPITRSLVPKDALFLRLRGDDVRIAEIRRQLGSQIASVDTVALPISDPDAMSWEVSSRLPDRTGVNLGGQRRRKKAR
jgi:hypothetical protein